MRSRTRPTPNTSGSSWRGNGLLADSNGLEKPAVKEAVEDVGNPPLERGARSRRRQTLLGVGRSRQLLLAGQGPTSNTPRRRLVDTLAAPTRAAWGKLKRLVRYLLQFPRLSWTFKRDECETGHHRRVLRLRLGGMCPYSAIHVRGRRHHRRIGDKTLELDAGDGGPLEWRGGVSGLGKGRLRGNRHPGVGP